MAMSHPVNLSNDRSTNHVISMNLSCRKIDGLSDAGNPLRRKKFIADVLMSREPDILLFQDFGWQGIKGSAWKDTPLPDHYVYTGHTQASIMYDTRRFHLTKLPQTQLRATLDEMKENGEVSQDFTPSARSCIRLWKPEGSDKFKVLVVSWHGDYTNSNEAEKKKQFKELQAYLKKLSECEHAAILLGGGFNIEMSLIKSLVLPQFILYEYTPSERRKGINRDYFMASPALTLTDVGYIDLTKTKGAIDDLIETKDVKDDLTEPKGAKDDTAKTKDVKDDLTKTKDVKDDLIKTEGAKDDKEKDTKTQDPYRLFDHDPIFATVVRRKALEKGDPLSKTLETTFSVMTLDSNN